MSVFCAYLLSYWMILLMILNEFSLHVGWYYRINLCDFSEWIYEWEYIWDFVIAHCSFCCLGVDAFAHILSLLAKLPTGILSSNCSYLPGFCTLMHKYWLLVWLGSLLYLVLPMSVVILRYNRLMNSEQWLWKKK